MHPAAQAPLRLGTRGSPLALWQARHVAALLGGAVEIVPMTTTGDRIQDRTLAAAGGKGLFTKELDEALLGGQVDLTVHSLKDVPTALPDGIVLAATPERDDPRDTLIGVPGLAALAPGAVVGTASLRRQSIVLHRRPDVNVVPLRGNVGTRLAKLREGQVQATLLALAGLRRLGLAHEATAILDPDEMLPAVAQGAIGVTCRTGDASLRQRLDGINHQPTMICTMAERALLAALDGSCRTPIAAHATLAGSTLHLRALIVTPDGRRAEATERRGPAGDGVALGRDAGAELKARGGADFFA
jgi:hydroxymethylbilane synthase